MKEVRLVNSQNVDITLWGRLKRAFRIWIASKVFDKDEPMLYTSRGHLPAKDLRRVVYWTVNEKEIVFREEWYDASEELVKGSSDVLPKQPTTAMGVDQASMG